MISTYKIVPQTLNNKFVIFVRINAESKDIHTQMKTFCVNRLVPHEPIQIEALMVRARRLSVAFGSDEPNCQYQTVDHLIICIFF